MNASFLQHADGAGRACRHHLVSFSAHTARLLLTPRFASSFATVGMFSAVSNLGAGGLSDVALSDTANGVLYGCFALTGLISGGITNRTSSLTSCPIAFVPLFLTRFAVLQCSGHDSLSSLVRSDTRSTSALFGGTSVCFGLLLLASSPSFPIFCESPDSVESAVT